MSTLLAPDCVAFSQAHFVIAFAADVLHLRARRAVTRLDAVRGRVGRRRLVRRPPGLGRLALRGQLVRFALWGRHGCDLVEEEEKP